MKGKTLELFGMIQRFLYWLAREADLNTNEDRATAKEAADAIDAQIDLFIEMENRDDTERTEEDGQQ